MITTIDVIQQAGRIPLDGAGCGGLPIGLRSPIDGRRYTQACAGYDKSSAIARKALFLREIFMIIIQKHMKFGILAIGALLISACQSTPDIRNETSPTATFATYKTFGYFSPLATDKAGYQSAFTGHLKTATRRVMESKGYVYSDTNADVLLNF